MNKKIYCKTTAKGIQSFYVKIGAKSYFLFQQKYYVGVKDFFSNGKQIDDLANACKNVNTAVRRTAEKIPLYLKYIEKEYDVVIFDKRQKRKSMRYDKIADRRESLNLFEENFLDVVC